MSEEVKKRFYGLDALKFICSFLVVCIHVRLQGNVLEDAIITFSRIAVPIFFMITGFFIENMIEKKRVFSYIKRLFILCIGANIFYILFNLCIVIFKDENIERFLGEVLGIRALVRFLLFNDTPIEGHLWYLSAVVYAIFFISLFIKHVGKPKNIMIILLLIFDLVFGKYSLFLLRREFNLIFIRNWLFVGVPYILIGLKIREWYFSRKNIIDKKKIIVALLLLFSLNLLERKFLIVKNCNAMRDHYICTTFLAIVIFILFLYQDNAITKKLAKWGKNYSLIVYIVHPAIISMMKICHVELEKYSLLTAIIVFGISVIISEIFYEVNKYFKQRKDILKVNVQKRVP